MRRSLEAEHDSANARALAATQMWSIIAYFQDKVELVPLLDRGAPQV